jgi:hypothetical protein
MSMGFVLKACLRSADCSREKPEFEPTKFDNEFVHQRGHVFGLQGEHEIIYKMSVIYWASGCQKLGVRVSMSLA